MNKKEIVKQLKTAHIDLSACWVMCGAALVLHGIRESTYDIDLGCTGQYFAQLIERGLTFKIWPDNTRSLHIRDTLEIFENWRVDAFSNIEGIQVASIADIIMQKKALGRAKDIRDLVLIDEYMRKRQRLDGSSVESRVS